ncbi:hypothetical protein F4818DRAFT_432391 [Hypoxylon cercidicola]|nr:hypothetical protein F4818DRAFT_432391 [Hypoxylon cercidicola]
MTNIEVVCALLMAGLTAVAIYVQVTSSTLSLPLSTGTTVLTILLPLLAAVNIFRARILHLFPHLIPQHMARAAMLQQFLPLVLQLIQGVLSVVLATLMAEGFVPGQMLDCSLEGKWQELWRPHEGHAIERIQDTFSCCGLRSIVDRNEPRGQCPILYKDRHFACLSPWRASMQRSAGLGFGVAIAVGILQLIQLALFTLRTSENGHARIEYRDIQSIESGASERLLGNGTVNDDGGDDDGTANGSGGGRRDYGATEEGPRVEPSGLGDRDEENTWRS